MNLYLTNFEINEGGGHVSFHRLFVGYDAIIIVLICCDLLLVKMKSASESSGFSNLLQETYEDLSVQRRMELLEKIKEENKNFEALEFEGID